MSSITYAYVVLDPEGDAVAAFPNSEMANDFAIDQAQVKIEREGWFNGRYSVHQVPHYTALHHSEGRLTPGWELS